MYKNTPHVQTSLMCGSQLHVEVWIPSHTEISDFTYVWVSFTCSTQMILVTFFLESGGELCIYTLAHVQKYPSRAKLSHMWISRVVSVHKTLPNATSLFNVMTSFDSRDLLPRRCLLHFKWYRICTAYHGGVHALKSWTGILLFLWSEISSLPWSDFIFT